jgi:hypothetical protein
LPFDYTGLAEQYEKFLGEDKNDNEAFKQRIANEGKSHLDKNNMNQFLTKRIYHTQMPSSKTSSIIKNQITDYVIMESLKQIILVDDKCHLHIFKLPDVDCPNMVDLGLRGPYAYIDSFQEILAVNDDTELVILDS